MKHTEPSVPSTVSIEYVTVEATFLEKLHQAEQRFSELEAMLSDSEITQEPSAYTRVLKEYTAMTPLIGAYRDYRSYVQATDEAESLLASQDKEMRGLAEEEYRRCKLQSEATFTHLKAMLLPKDPDDGKNIMVEIRAGTGGEEAALFASDLFRMYSLYADRLRYSVTVESANRTELGGYKEIVFCVSGDGAYSKFKFESGVHRVQRVPTTGAADKLQTSAATVAVLPEADEIAVEILPSDLVFESCKSSGAGGQHINKTESAVRLTHKPSGIVVECQEERSQLQNKNKALQMLRTKLFAIKQTEAAERLSAERRQQVSTGDRSAKIRTYNFPQNRVTDHRIGLTLYELTNIMNGDIGGLIDALIAADTAEKFRQAGETP